MTQPTFLNVSMNKNSDLPELDLNACVERWAHLQDAVQGKRWLELNPEMVADFVRSTAHTLTEQFGKQAALKTTEMFSCILASFNKSNFSLSGIWMEGDASVRLSFGREKLVEAQINSLPKKAKPGHSPIAQAFKQPTSPEEAEPRFVFDPLKDLPNTEVRAIVGVVEDWLSDTPRMDRDILVGAAAVLLTWQMLEKDNMSVGRMSFSGMKLGEEVLWEGDTMVVKFKASLFDKLAQNKEWTPMVWEDYTESDNPSDEQVQAKKRTFS